MYAGLRKVLEMSNDARVSDRQFRSAIQRMINWKYHKNGYAAGLELLHQEAIIETEREEFIRQS